MNDDADRKQGTAGQSPRIVEIDTLEPVSRFDQLKAALAAAPDDDELLTDEDRAAIEVGLEDYHRGRTITLEELLKQETQETETAASQAG